jgi:hypothetical protein
MSYVPRAMKQLLPEPSQGPRQMCREGQDQSWEEGVKRPFLWYLQTCEGRKHE